MNKIDRIWAQARDLFTSAIIDGDDFESVIYRGIKLVRYEGIVRIYSTDSPFYDDITDSFIVDDDFLICVKYHLRAKYLRGLDKVERMITREMNGHKNHKRITYLKTMRETYLNKYNGVNT